MECMNTFSCSVLKIKVLLGAEMEDQDEDGGCSFKWGAQGRHP